MIGERLQQAQKIAQKRWDWYHKTFRSVIWPVSTDDIPVGVYKKRKGCECRDCSSNNQILKHQSKKKARARFIMVSKGYYASN